MVRRLISMFWLIGFLMILYYISGPIKGAMDSIDSLALPLTGKVIVVDPGHGGMDGGAVGADQTLEKEIALIVSHKLRDYLQQSGANVYLTRETDRDLAEDSTNSVSQRKVEDIKNRVAFMEEKDPDIFITIHLNALPSTQWRGAQTFYHPNQPQSQVLAETIQAQIRTNLENTTRQALAINGVYVLKHANRPAALVEIGFLSNPDERELLKQASYQDEMAASIYLGVLEYFSEQN
ncbi:N-acetylmuramoyl-L-alanine amidase CwlD [Amphibacillus indicireducens]|uniref:N-acetylmuramoyl-L-alanine amidase CwlD n=1 Tax=Amphibacillus indicireducens TaxID=1076330 RepID=A0ABP7V4M5_9BACI